VKQIPLLTIIIPTYNRRNYLSKLLSQLEQEIIGLEGIINIIIADNNSTDGTALEIEKYIDKNPQWQVIRHEANIGFDRNCMSAIESSASQYFWIIGDDDLPRNGLIKLIVNFLQSKRPTLLYLYSQWSPVVEASDLPPLQMIKPVFMSPIQYAEKINIFTTFISAWIVDAFTLKKLGIDSQELSKGIGSNFVQLGWILPLIRDSSILAAIDEPAILATGGNTGGYQLIKTFAVNYPAFVRKIFPRQKGMQKAFLAPFAKEYLPMLIRSTRLGHYDRMLKEENTLLRAIKSLGLYKNFWLHTFPAFVLPPNIQAPKSEFHHSLPARIARKIKRELRQIAMPAYTIAINKLSAQVVANIEKHNAEQKKLKVEAELAKLKEAGENINLPDDFDLIGHKYISLGSQFQANRGLRIHCWETHTIEDVSSPTLMIGDRIFFNREAYVTCANSIRIGSDTLLGSNVLITDNYHGSTKIAYANRMESPLSCPGTVEIEDGVWIGNNVCVLPGSRIGRGSIIGANSVVNSVIPAFSIAVGAPARVVGSLSATEAHP